MVRLLALDVASAEGAAKEIRVAAGRAGYQGLYAFPWNRFGAESPTWWLSPSTEVPAYKCGKIVLTRRDSDLGDLFVGLYVEKGVGPSASSAFADTKRGRSYIMTPEWTWHSFIRSLRAGSFDPLVAEAEERAGGPIVVVVDASNIDIPIERGGTRSAGRNRAEALRDVIRFECSGRQLRCVRSDTPAGILRGCERFTGLADLAQGIEVVWS